METQQTLTNSPATAQTCAIGLDIGGTKIAGGIVAFPAGQLLVKQLISTHSQRGGEAVLADALALARQLLGEAQASGWPVMGIGIGVPELVDLAGNITSSHNFAWRGIPVQAHFARLAPALVESDVRAAALAEAMFGAGRAFKLFAYVTIGTGISYSLVQEGRPYPGARGNALVLASSPLTTTCTACGTVLKPIVEELATGPALVARYNHQNSAQPFSRAEEVLLAAQRGDPIAIHVVKTAAEALGVSAGFLVNVLDPEAVIVGGGLGLAGGLYWTSLIAATRHHIWSDTNRDLPILPATLGVEAGLIGAAAAVWRRASEINQTHT